jgi:hypothetical protein
MRPSDAAALAGAASGLTLSEQPTSSAPNAGGRCPSCTTPYAPGDVFCEVCGTNFVTGEESPLPTPPREVVLDDDDPAPPIAADWCAVIDADRELFEANQAETPEKLEFPDVVVAREVPLTGEEMIIGRREEPSGFFPDIDLSTPMLDPGVSRRHAVLRRQPDGAWTVTDCNSTNGTWLNGADTPLPPAEAVRLSEGDRITVGAFSCIVVRRNCERAGG